MRIIEWLERLMPLAWLLFAAYVAWDLYRMSH